MKKFILFCDFMGYEPKLHVEGQENYRTLFTGIISIIMSILAVTFSGYFGSDLIYRSAPTVIKSLESIEKFAAYNFSNTGYNIMIGMQDKNFKYFSDPTIFSVRAELIKITNDISNSSQSFSMKSIKMNLCSNYYTQEDIVEKNMVFPLNMYYCPEPNSAYMEGFWGAPKFTALKIYFEKCTNSSENNNHCQSTEVIDKTIQGSYMAYELTSYKVDPTDFNFPLKRIFADSYNIINAKLGLEYVIAFEPLRFSSNDGLVINSFSQFNALNFNEKIFYKLNENQEKTFVSFIFEGTASSTAYVRSYIKLQTVITQIGGFLKMLSVIATVITRFTSHNYYFLSFFSKLPLKHALPNDNSRIHILEKPTSLNIAKNNLIHDKNSEKANSNQRKSVYTFDNSNNKKIQQLVDSPKKIYCAVMKYLKDKIFFCKRKSKISLLNIEIQNLYKEITSIEEIILLYYKINDHKKNLAETQIKLKDEFGEWYRNKISEKLGFK
jgi:hypothetical protein